MRFLVFLEIIGTRRNNHHSGPLARPVRASGSTGSNEKCVRMAGSNLRFTPAPVRDGWEMVLGLVPPNYRPIWPYKTRETFIVLLFSHCYFPNISLWRVGVQQKSMISSLLQTISSRTILLETASKS